MILTWAITAVLWAFPPAAVAGCFPIPIPPFFACTLDRGGLLEPTAPDYYVCRKEPVTLTKEGAGGKPDFKIGLKVFCGVHPGEGLPGWTPVDWDLVTVRGEYDYETKTGVETIWNGPGVEVESRFQCTANPWAHPQSCQLTEPLINNTGAEVNGPFPRTAWLSSSLWQALADWETTPTTEELLADWNPYGQPADYSMEIAQPTWHEVIPPDAPFFELHVSLLPGTSTPAALTLEWQKIEPGPQWVKDLYVSSPHVWKPFAGPQQAPWNAFPLVVPVNPGYFVNQPGLYEVRVRDAATGVGSGPVRFWIGAPSFEPPAPPPGSEISSSAAIAVVSSQSFKGLSERAAASRRALVTRPRIVMERFELAREPERGQPLDIAVTVRNTGLTASRPDQEKVFLTCAPPGRCETLVAEWPIPRGLDPGEAATLTIRGAVEAPDVNAIEVFASTAPIWRPPLLELPATRQAVR